MTEPVSVGVGPVVDHGALPAAVKFAHVAGLARFPSLKPALSALWYLRSPPPAGALFFSAKDAFSTAISNNIPGGQYAELTTLVAVGLAQFPYWGIRTPAELLKIR